MQTPLFALSPLIFLFGITNGAPGWSFAWSTASIDNTANENISKNVQCFAADPKQPFVEEAKVSNSLLQSTLYMFSLPCCHSNSKPPIPSVKSTKDI